MRIKNIKYLTPRFMSNKTNSNYLQTTLNNISENPFLENPQHDYPKFVNKISYLLYNQLSDHIFNTTNNTEFKNLILNHQKVLEENKYIISKEDDCIRICYFTKTHKLEIILEHLYFSYNKDLSEIESISLFEKIRKRKDFNYTSKKTSDELDFFVDGKMVNSQAKPYVLSNFNSEDKTINLVDPFSLKKSNKNIIKLILSMSPVNGKPEKLSLTGHIVD